MRGVVEQRIKLEQQRELEEADAEEKRKKVRGGAGFGAYCVSATRVVNIRRSASRLGAGYTPRQAHDR